MIAKLKSKLSLLSRKTITKDIQGQPWVFSPVSLALFYELKSSLEPIWLAVQTLMRSSDGGDGERTVSQQKTPEGLQETITHLRPPSVEMARFRADRQDKATRDALQAILGEPSRQALARILADSLREDCGRLTDAEAMEFFSSLEVPTAIEFLGAFIEVNASVFGPLVSRAVVALKSKMNLQTGPAAPSVESVENPTG